FHDVSIQCGNDYLIICDGPSSESPVIGQLCSLPDDHTLTSTSNSLLITFMSDSSTSDRGFSLTYNQI
ncbi:tolloid-like protein 1, partial [Biomphalaria glabrata]